MRTIQRQDMPQTTQKAELETVAVRSLEELRKLVNEIPDGTVYSIQMEVVLIDG